MKINTEFVCSVKTKKMDTFREVNSTEVAAVSRETIDNIRYLPIQVYQFYNVFGHSESGYSKELIFKCIYILFYNFLILTYCTL